MQRKQSTYRMTEIRQVVDRLKTRSSVSQPAAALPQSEDLYPDRLRVHVLRYVGTVEPYYRGRNRHFYEYRAAITAHYTKDSRVAPHIVWELIRPLRREVKAAMEAELQVYRAHERQAMLERQAVRVRKSEELSMTEKLRTRKVGMAGKRHTEEAKAKIRAAIKAHHAARVYEGKITGRPSKAAIAATIEEQAAALGLSVPQFKSKLEYLRRKNAEYYERRATLARKGLDPDAE